MRRYRLLILIGELFLITVALAIPPVDLPETSFNESNTPVNEATVPVVLSSPTALIRLQTAVVTPAPVVPQASVYARVSSKTNPVRRSHSHSLFALLCTFLC